MSALDVVVGRQPIFDRGLLVIGYELLFRPLGLQAVAGSKAQGDQMTAEVLFSSISMGIERLVGDKKVFCNASRGVLTGEIPIVLPPERTLIEIVESVVTDEAVLSGCRNLRDEGYELVLDDFTFSQGAESLLELASIVKLDLRLTEPSALRGLIERCRAFDVALVAEKVETLEDLRICEKLGFDYFQGYLLAKPRHVAGRAMDVGRLAKLQLSASLIDSECRIAELEKVVRSDPAMAHQLLQLAGVGAAGGLRRDINTIQEALVILGWRRLQSWVSLMFIADKGRGWQEGVTNALIRARMCELSAETLDRSLSDVAFTAGMVSSFDVLLGMPLDEILRSLPLASDIGDAILRGEGTLGKLIFDVIDYLMGRPEQATRSGLEETVLSSSSYRALMWAVELSSIFDVATDDTTGLAARRVHA